MKYKLPCGKKRLSAPSEKLLLNWYLLIRSRGEGRGNHPGINPGVL